MIKGIKESYSDLIASSHQKPVVFGAGEPTGKLPGIGDTRHDLAQISNNETVEFDVTSVEDIIACDAVLYRQAARLFNKRSEA